MIKHVIIHFFSLKNLKMMLLDWFTSAHEKKTHNIHTRKPPQKCEICNEKYVDLLKKPWDRERIKNLTYLIHTGVLQIKV